MDKKKQEKMNRKKDEDKFNSITNKGKPENQNQTHNVRSEAVEPKNRQVWKGRSNGLVTVTATFSHFMLIHPEPIHMRNTLAVAGSNRW